MGFYGKISNSNKTAFSFDRTYATRQAMDATASSDGVFIGRYVLVEYDEPPITGYYNRETEKFYSSIQQGGQTEIIPRTGVVYQDLLHASSAFSFYYWDSRENKYKALTGSQTGYAAHFGVDVQAYGRGYDSTAWMKTYDVEKGVYKYVLVAELNTIVPVFHLISDAPTATPTAPYFDQDTTTVDYYLHSQAVWGVHIRPYNVETLNTNDIQHNAASNVISMSDEMVKGNQVVINTDPNGVQTFEWKPDGDINGDIYYNKAGFEKEIRTISPRDASTGKTIIANTINYDFNYSGRKYGGGLTDRGVWNEGSIEKDMMDWYIHLPVLGDTISEVWDVLYGFNNNPENENYRKRYIRLTSQRADENALVSYSHNTVYGSLNMVRDLLGYPIEHIDNNIELDNQTKEPVNAIRTSDPSVANKLYYTSHYIATKEEEVRDDYYYYAYDPNYIRVYKKENTESTYYYLTADNPPQSKEFDVSQLYFCDTNGIYRKPNLKDWPARLSDNTEVGHEYNELYARQDAWKLCKLNTPIEDSLYGLIIELHRLMGDRSLDVRDENSIIGCINLTKDMVARIDKDLAPCKLLATAESGQIYTTNTEFPYYNSMSRIIDGVEIKHQELLDSGGTWRLPVDYRLYTYTLKNSNNANLWYDTGYYGDSLLHRVDETDRIGDAARKIENELSDLEYIAPTAKLEIAAREQGEANTSYLYIENGKNITDVELVYTLNKGPRQSIVLTRIGGSIVYSLDNIDSEIYLTNGYAATATATKHDTNQIVANNFIDQDITYRVTVVDERSASASAEAQIHYANKAYWGVGGVYTVNALNTYAALTSALSGGGSKLARSKFNPTTMIAGVDQYVYWMQPSAWEEPIFQICGIEGGMDYIGETAFTNGSGYQCNYKIWRSTYPNLGATDLVLL